jgi:hypothetical protein
MADTLLHLPQDAPFQGLMSSWGAVYALSIPLHDPAGVRILRVFPRSQVAVEPVTQSPRSKSRVARLAHHLGGARSTAGAAVHHGYRAAVESACLDLERRAVSGQARPPDPGGHCAPVRTDVDSRHLPRVGFRHRRLDRFEQCGAGRRVARTNLTSR